MILAVNRRQNLKSGLLGKSLEFHAEIKVAELTEEESDLIEQYEDPSVLPKGKTDFPEFKQEIKNGMLSQFWAEVSASEPEAAEKGIEITVGMLNLHLIQLRAKGHFQGEQRLEL